jgi:hypothetical protein
MKIIRDEEGKAIAIVLSRYERALLVAILTVIVAILGFFLLGGIRGGAEALLYMIVGYLGAEFFERFQKERR